MPSGPLRWARQSFTLCFLILSCAAAQSVNNSNDSNGSNGSNATNCTDNFTAVNEANYTGPPLCPQEPAPPCYTDKCRGTIVREAVNSCMELSFWGADAARCAFFNESAFQACNISCQNCGSIASAIYDECLFTLLADSVQFDEAQGVCQGVADDFETLRCPSALLDTSECYTRESNDCQANCGNWHKCNCWKSRGFPGEPDQCEGETELLRLDGTPDNCDGISRMCFNHRPSTLCGKYKHCPANICIITGKTCPLTDPCQDVGVCAPGDGQCYYSTLPDGTPCTDGKDYTHTDTCQNAVCTGIEDKCVRFDVKCNTLNSCLVPTDKVEGACDPPTGSCVFEAKPDDTPCSSQYGGVVDGKCGAGLCRRELSNIPEVICKDKICTNSVFCTGQVGTCDPWTGQCVFTPEPEGTKCEDGDPNTYDKRCVEGQCVGHQLRDPKYAFEGYYSCEGHAGFPADIPRYFGNVLVEEECREQCTQDPWCSAYAYGYYICYIYGGQRTKDPNAAYWGQTWLRLEPAGQPEITHAITCFSKQDKAREEPFFNEKNAWFGLTVVIVVVIPALWGLAMVWRPLSRSFRNLTGCCGGLGADEWSPSKEDGSRGPSKDQIPRSISQMSFGPATSKVHAQQIMDDDETMDDSMDSSRMTEDALAQPPEVRDLEQVKWNQAQEPEEPRSPHDPRGEVEETKAP